MDRPGSATGSVTTRIARFAGWGGEADGKTRPGAMSWPAVAGSITREEGRNAMSWLETAAYSTDSTSALCSENQRLATGTESGIAAPGDGSPLSAESEKARPGIICIVS